MINVVIVYRQQSIIQRQNFDTGAFKALPFLQEKIYLFKIFDKKSAGFVQTGYGAFRKKTEAKKLQHKRASKIYEPDFSLCG